MDEGFDLKWRNHVPEVFGILCGLRDKDAFSDVLLYCDGEQFLAHKVMLAACSTFFERILSNLPPDKVRTLVMAETRPDMLQLVLDFMYNGEVFVETSVLQAFMDTAERLEVRGLRKSDDVAAAVPLPPPLNEIPARADSRSPVASPVAVAGTLVPVPVELKVPVLPKITKPPARKPPPPVKRLARPAVPLPEEQEEERDAENNIGGEVVRNGMPAVAPPRKKLKTTISITGTPGGRKIFSGLPPGITIEPTGAANVAKTEVTQTGAIRVTPLPKKSENALAAEPEAEELQESRVETEEDFDDDDLDEDDDDVMELRDGGSVKTEYVDSNDRGDYSNDASDWAEGHFNEENRPELCQGDNEQYQHQPGSDSDERPQNIPPEISTSQPIRRWQQNLKQVWVGTNVFGQITYFCGLCGYTSSNSSHVKRHFLVHTGERPFICKICGRAFNLKWNLKSHYLTVHQTALLL